MGVQMVTLNRSVRTWNAKRGCMYPWREMTPAEFALHRYVELQPSRKFVSFRDVQVPIGRVIGVVMANGARRLVAFGAPYIGFKFQGSIALGWMVLDGMDVAQIGDSRVSVVLGDA